MRTLVWFRRDLRTSDHPALHEACRRSDRGVVAVFLASPAQWAEHDEAPVKVDYWRRCLAELSNELAARNVALRIADAPRFRDAPDALLALAREHACDALAFNREYEVNERERDERVTRAFEDAGLAVHAHVDRTLFEPGEVLTGSDRFYTVFTPFRKRWTKLVREDETRRTPLGPPRAPDAMVGAPDPVPDAFEGFAPPTGEVAARWAEDWPAGEAAANGRLGAFVRHRLEAYDDDRDLPAEDGTSRLSAPLAAGVLSLRGCLHAALEANDGRLDDGRPGAVTWISELCWREFYQHVLVGFPRVCMHRAFKPETEAIEWSDDDAHETAWREGRTGYPLVDAAMRQLAATGWMHNRLRMVVAMFLSKNLFLDWRRGESFFMRSLVDGDLAANNGGWQWSASTGTDAAPYFRVFNPWSQSEKFDRDGAFIRRFVPELADVPAKRLHAPPKDGRPIAPDYPLPIVDAKATRQAAIDAFKALHA